MKIAIAILVAACAALVIVYGYVLHQYDVALLALVVGVLLAGVGACWSEGPES